MLCAFSEQLTELAVVVRYVIFASFCYTFWLSVVLAGPLDWNNQTFFGGGLRFGKNNKTSVATWWDSTSHVMGAVKCAWKQENTSFLTSCSRRQRGIKLLKHLLLWIWIVIHHEFHSITCGAVEQRRAVGIDRSCVGKLQARGEVHGKLKVQWPLVTLFL